MKKLESLKEFQLKNEVKEIDGGASGTFYFNGSLCTYDGTFSMTNHGSKTEGIDYVVQNLTTTNNITTDFCGTATADSSATGGCFSYQGGWVRL